MAKVLDTEIFPQHTIAGLISGITFVLFSQEKPLRLKETNTDTDTHTQTHTHTQSQDLLKNPGLANEMKPLW